MQQIILIFHILTCLALVALILLQRGKGAEAGAGLGGSGASQTVFGSRGANSFLLKLTGAAAALFFLTSIALNYLSSQEMVKAKGLEGLPLPVTHAIPMDKSLELPENKK
jgi:preprotein translocase subunit SecG